MPGQKISSLTPVSDLQAADQFPLARSGSTYKITGDKFASKAQLDSLSATTTGSFALKTDLASLSSTSSTGLTGLSSTVDARLVALSAAVDANFLNYLPLSGGIISGNLTVSGNLSSLGTTTQIDTLVFMTSAVSVTNVGSGPALTVRQTGAQDIATFFDDSSVAMIVKDGGNVGIGTSTPYAKLTVIGDISATGDIVAFSLSDKRLKNDITPITNALEKVSSIQGVEYVWNTELQTVYSGNDVGVIAQEVESVLPVAVIDRDNGYKAVKYEKLIPLLIEAIKDLKTEIQNISTKTKFQQND